MQGCASGLFGNGPAVLSEGLVKLLSEHPPLRDQLNRLYFLCHKVKEEDRAPFEELIHEVKDFNTNLCRHSQREEDILFRMMEKYLGEHGGPIAVMEYEHERAHGLISEFLKKAEDPASLVTDDSNLIEEAYHTLLEHFNKEEQVLYPMAERMFTPEEKEIVNQKVSEVQ